MSEPRIDWTSGSGRIELSITAEQAMIGSHQGDCKSDIDDLMELPEIKSQLEKLDVKTLKKELQEYGAWDDSELDDHDDNLCRILWIACGDILDGNV